MKRPFVVAVTGGIGSGKTTVCNLFARRHGIAVVDADIAAREVVEPGEPGFRDTVAAFGPGVLTDSGHLDRAALKRIVFADDTRRKQLESILHPLIRAHMEEQVMAVTDPYCLLCIPLLTEKKGYAFIDRVLVVDCSEDAQVARVRARDNLTEQDVIAIMQTQASRETRLAISDDVIVNEDNSELVTARVDELHEQFLGIATARA